LEVRKNSAETTYKYNRVGKAIPNFELIRTPPIRCPVDKGGALEGRKLKKRKGPPALGARKEKGFTCPKRTKEP